MNRYKIKIILGVIVLLKLSVSTVWVSAQSLLTQRENTYAVIIGISEYQNPGVPPLQFADRDARAFADFLQSKSGGFTPASHINLLINERATFAAIYNALFSLLDSAKQNDLIYFYFSGHGDVENQFFANLGYLLSYNTPPNNYINHAIRIEDVNLVANTLSLSKGAKVVLITDACHSGKLAGDAIGGRKLIGSELNTAKRNEVRLAACAPDQLSAENEAWGGGRGVFSYYLEQGLYGLANTENNSYVSSGELKNYLVKSLENDRILKREKFIQVPMVTGSNSLPLATIDKEKLASIRKVRNNQVLLPGILSDFPPIKDQVATKPIDLFFNFLGTINPQQIKGLNALDTTLSKEEILGQFADLVRPLMPPDDKSIMLSFLLELKTNENLKKQFTERVVAYIADQGQELITAYLKGDQAELDKRSYFNFSQRFYDNYLILYKKALDILPRDHYLYHSLEVNFNYFSGVVYRLKFPTVPDPSGLFDTAMQFQLKAFQLEPYAAYLNNELGVLYSYKDNFDSTFYFYNRASKLSPTWAIPLANMVGYFNRKGDLNQARVYASRAREFKPDLQILLSNEGLTEELSKNFLRAEELQLKIIRMSDKHYLPFEKLGNIYAATTRFERAEKYYYQADLRKKGFFLTRDTDADGVPDVIDREPSIDGSFAVSNCDIKNPDSLEADTYWLLIAIHQARNEDGFIITEKRLRRALTFSGTNFLLNHYYGHFLLNQNRFVEAEPYLKKSVDQYISFEALLDQLMRSRLPSKMRINPECLSQYVRNLYFEQTADQFVLADIYKKLGYIEHAIHQYDTLIAYGITGDFVAASFLKAELLFRHARYGEAEKTWLNFRTLVLRVLSNEGALDFSLRKILKVSQGNFELDHFYADVVDAMPESGYWQKKAANHWFDKIIKNPELYFISDSKQDIAVKGVEGFDEFNYLESIANIKVIPGINQRIPFKWPVSYTLERAFRVLQSAIRFAELDEDIISLNIKRGQLLSLDGKPEQAALHYANALDIAPDDASIRIVLADMYDEAVMLTDAYGQLDTLNLNGQLLTDRYLGFAEMAIHKGDSSQAKNMLQKCKDQLFQLNDSVNELLARFYFVSNNVSKALPYYLDSIKTTMIAPERLYAIAALYAKSGNFNEAKKWLIKALDAGFPYGLVIENDPVWQVFRTKPGWKELMAKGQFIYYTDLE